MPLVQRISQTTWQSQQGFSLVEVIIASFLGLLLLGGLIEVYLSVKTTYALQNALARMQENGRFATYFLQQAIRTAGYVGCQNPNQPVQTESAIQGYSSQHLPSFLQQQVAAGTDAIVITECTRMGGKQQIAAVSFFIGDTKRRNQRGDPIYALYKKIAKRPRLELVTGVENMRLQYGVSDEQKLGVARYAPATQLTAQDWLKVRSVKIALLLDSIEATTLKPKPYTFAGTTFAAHDQLLRREWDIYIALRERLS